MTCAPNHHARYPAFSGVPGLIAAFSMVPGRDGDARLAARLSNTAAGDTVVDIGCGPGAAARHAAQRGASVIGVDPASVMLRVARVLTPPWKTIRYVEAAAEDLPLPDGVASIVWTIASVHHWADIASGLCEVHRVLGEGGRFVAIERQRQHGARGLASHGWTDEQAAAFADHCLQTGFIDARVEKHDGGRRQTVSVTAMRD
jgi:ubiquinone/menaquinone biosynthesis C-methylase UbiE